MRLLRIAVAVIATGLVAGAHTARADDTMRCGSRLVSVGDGKDKVRALCGEPSAVTFLGIVRWADNSGYGNRGGWYLAPSWSDVPAELWTYNFGSSKLLRKLRFNGDELVDIRTDGYGY